MNQDVWELIQKKWLWLVLSCGILILVACGFFFYTNDLQPYLERKAELDREINLKQAKLKQIIAQKQRLKDLEIEIGQAEMEFTKLKEMFPDQEVIPKRLLDLTNVTRKSLTVPTKFLPLQTEEREFYRENHYSITISSSYHSLGLLFGEIASFRYPTAISKMQIDKVPDLETAIQEAKEHGETPRTIVASFELTTFTSKK